MADNVLDIILRAEVDQATADIVGFGKKVEQEVGGSTKEYKKLEAELDKVKKALQALEKTKSAPDVKPVRDLTGTIGVLIGRLPKLRDALLASTDPKQIERLNNILGATQARITALSTPTQGFAKGLGAIAVKAPNATNTLTNFGRVIQDAPFGIIGIANNIDPLIESFGRLSKSTGSTGGALKALGGALLGPAGIALGVSAVTSALIAFGPQIADALSGVSAFEKALNEASTAGFVAFKTAQIEFSKFATVLNDGNSSITQQKQAFDGLNSSLSKYGLELTSISAFQKESEEIGKKFAQIKANEAKVLALAAVAATKYAESITAQAFAAEQSLKAVSGTFTEKLLFFATPGSIAALGKANDKIKNSSEEIGNFDSAINKVNKENQQLLLDLENLDSVIPKVTDKNKGLAESSRINAEAIFSEDVALKKLEASNALRVGTGSKLIEVIAAETNGLIALSKEVERVTAAKQKANIAEKAASLIAVPTFTGNANLLGPSAAALEAQSAAAAAARASVGGLALAFDDLNINMETVTSGIASSAIDGIFNAIASGENVFDSLIDSLKGFVLEIIKAIAKALILQAITKAFEVSSGGSTSFFGALLGGRANGGPVNAGVAYNVGEAGPEIFVPSTSGQIVSGIGTGGSGGGTLTTAISGNNLLFILNQASGNRQNNFG